MSCRVNVTYDGILVLDRVPHSVRRVQERPQSQKLPRMTHVLLQVPELGPAAAAQGRTVQDLEAVLQRSKQRKRNVEL